MKIIVCVDNEYGMMFNNRRQSRDSEVINHIMHNVGTSLWIGEYSKDIFVDCLNKYSIGYSDEGDCLNVSMNQDNVCRNIKIIVDNNMFHKASDNEWCFVEDISLENYKESINEISMYNWNKKYPADKYLELDINSYNCTQSVEIKGFSHDVITINYYKK